MERAGFILTMLAGILTCTLLGWQAIEGVRAGWVGGFLCVMWSVMMMLRLMALTSPAPASEGGHLAQKIIHGLYGRQEATRAKILQQSFGTSFAVFLLLGFVFAAWQIFCAVFTANNFALSGLSFTVRDFFAAGGASPLMTQPAIFDWGQSFLFLLCLSMMGFLLRSYSARKDEIRIALLVLAGYATSGWIFFLWLNDANGNAVLDMIITQSGVLGLALLAFILFVPLGFIWLSIHHPRPDWVVIVGGTLAAAALTGCLFLTAGPFIGAFSFLCWMAVFLAWGAAENRLDALPA